MTDTKAENVQVVPKHTPGPWPWEHTGDGKRITIGKGLVEGPRGYEVAEVYADDCDQAEAEANARLIAAAPDLLDVAQAAPIPSQYHGVRGFDADGFLDAYAVWNGKRRVVIARTTGAAP